MAFIMQRHTSGYNYAEPEEDGKKTIGSEFVDLLAPITPAASLGVSVAQV